MTRNVARTSAAYGVAALGIVLAVRFATVGGLLPAGWMTGLVFVAVAAYPVVLALVWMRDEAAAGERDADPRDRFVGATGLACVLLAVAAGLGTVDGSRPEPSAPAAVGTPRIVVLPLIDIDGGGERYFVEGLTGELAAALSMIEGVEVRGRVSAVGFVDVNRDAAALGRRLGGDVVLDGTIRRYGGRLRLGVRLVDASTGTPVWSTSLDTTRAALFALRDDAVRGVARALGLGQPDDRVLRRLDRRRTSAEAFDLYLLGRQRGSGARGDLLEAASYFHLAIEADSGFAPAWTALAEAYATLPRFTRFPPDRARGEGAAAARTALRLEPDAAAAHTVLGEILYLYEHDWAGARSHLERAVELDPGGAEPRERLCELSLILGEFGAAESACGEALKRDPLAFRPAWTATWIDRSTGDLDAALASLDSLASAHPDFEPLIADRALARLVAGDTAALKDHLADWFVLLGPAELADTLATGLAGAWPPEPGGSRASRAVLARVEADLEPSAVHLAALLSLFGDRERASEVAVVALAGRMPEALRLGVFPEYSGLHEHDELRRALAEAGLPVR